MTVTLIDRYVQQANLLREDLARIARQIEDAARAVDDARRQPLELKTRIKEVEDNIATITVNIEAEVAAEPADPLTANPKFKNQDARKAETAKRVRADKEIQAYQTTLRSLESQKLDADIRLGSAETTLKAYTTVQAAKAGETELLAATIRALAPNSLSAEALAEIEAYIVGRLSTSLKTGPMGQIVRDVAREAVAPPAATVDAGGTVKLTGGATVTPIKAPPKA